MLEAAASKKKMRKAPPPTSLLACQLASLADQRESAISSKAFSKARRKATVDYVKIHKLVM